VSDPLCPQHVHWNKAYHPVNVNAVTINGTMHYTFSVGGVQVDEAALRACGSNVVEPLISHPLLPEQARL
jgi:hypothetical protein